MKKHAPWYFEVVMISSPTCGNCRRLEPKLKKALNAFESMGVILHDFEVFKTGIDSIADKLLKENELNMLPAVLVYDFDENLIHKFVGDRTKEYIEDFINDCIECMEENEDANDDGRGDDWEEEWDDDWDEISDEDWKYDQWKDETLMREREEREEREAK